MGGLFGLKRETNGRQVLRRCALDFAVAGGSARGCDPRNASSETFCSSIVLMLICIRLRLICNQPSITLRSPILRSTSAGSSVANIAAGLGNGRPLACAVAGVAGAPGTPKPGMGIPNGFHIFCMKSIASCGENGNAGESAGASGGDGLIVIPVGDARPAPGAECGRRGIRLLSSFMTDIRATLRARLDAAVGSAQVLTAAADIAPYLADWRGQYHGRAQAVVRPGTTAEVSAVVRACAEARVPIVPQGGNTGQCGGATPDATGEAIVLSLARMNRVRAIDPGNATLTLDAGVTLAAAQQAAADAGLMFPLSLAAEGSCTIGGNLSTNAGGTAVLRFGNARELTLGIEVVLADGRVWDGLRGLRKDNTGYDLKQLFIGAEGTLGIVTAMVLKLYAAPRARA